MGNHLHTRSFGAIGRGVILLALAALLAACAARPATRGQITGADAPPGAAITLAGSYSVNGVDPIGTEYGGNLTIRPGDRPDEYKLQWIITGSIQEGTGRLDSNRLRVEWQTAPGMRPASGVTTYTVTTKGELYGTRSVTGFPKEGSEKAFPNPK
jgi:hypothetical protein